MKDGVISEKTRSIIEDFEQHHDHSWYVELWCRNQEYLNDNALLYRGNYIKYKEMFQRMSTLAAAMQAKGVKKGTEIPVCLSNTPELIYVMGAASILGAVINVFSYTFPLDYISEIINECDSHIGFFTDNYFEKIHTAVEKSTLDCYVLSSLGDSLPKDMLPEEVEGSEFVSFVSSVKTWEGKCSKAIWFYDFLKNGKDHNLVMSEAIHLEDDFTVTYTSGSTNALRPKAIVQRVRSFTVIGRFHDSDVMHGLSFKKFRGMALIPPHSNTDLISCISDTLMQGAVLSLEPVYNERFFLNSILINKPCFVIATRSFWITAMKRLLNDENYRHIKLPFLLMVFAVGEELSVNEERFLNKAMRKVDAGKDFHHLPISPICFCVAGGDCEHGSILYRLFRNIMNFTLDRASEKRYGMTAFDFVDIAVLDSNGNKLGPNKVGRLVANSPCTMRCYKNNPVATETFFIKDSDGKTWGDMSVFGYMDKKGRVYMRNRIIDNKQQIPPFKISDAVLKCKKILSREVVVVEEGYVSHIELVPGCSDSYEKVIREAKQNIRKNVGDLHSDMFFRIHKGECSFQLTGSGKRDIRALITEGTNQCYQSEKKLSSLLASGATVHDV